MPTTGEDSSLKPPNATAPSESSEPRLIFVTPAPLPLNMPEMATPLAMALVVTAPVASWPAPTAPGASITVEMLPAAMLFEEMVPVSCAVLTVPLTLSADPALAARTA